MVGCAHCSPSGPGPMLALSLSTCVLHQPPVTRVVFCESGVNVYWNPCLQAFCVTHNMSWGCANMYKTTPKSKIISSKDTKQLGYFFFIFVSMSLPFFSGRVIRAKSTCLLQYEWQAAFEIKSTLQAVLCNVATVLWVLQTAKQTINRSKYWCHWTHPHNPPTFPNTGHPPAPCVFTVKQEG